MELNLKIINETWKVFDSINDKLAKHGIFVNKLVENKLFFTVNLDIAKNNIIGFKFEISNDQIIISKITNNETSVIEINPCFPAISFLKNIYEHLEINVYNRYENEYLKDDFDTLLNNLKDEEHKQSLNELNSYVEKIKKDVSIIKKIKMVLKSTKDEFDLSNNKKKKELIQTNMFRYCMYIKKIYGSNEKLYKDFVLETTNFIKILFPEIFDLETTRQNLPENINMYNKKYVELSKELKDNLDYFNSKIYNQIIELLEYISDNMYLNVNNNFIYYSKKQY